MNEVDWQPILTGELVELRPLRAEHWNELFAVASDPLIWEVHPANDRWQEPVFRAFFEDGLASGGALAVFERATGRIIGSSRYDHHRPAHSQVEIGWTFLARSHWGGICNREVKRLMLDHAFRFVEKAVFAVADTNVRSRHALEKIGARWNGEAEERMTKGAPVRHLVYELRRGTEESRWVGA